MKIWKQFLVCLALVAALAGSLIIWHPEAPAMLAKYGLDRFIPASLAQNTETSGAQNGQAGGQPREQRGGQGGQRRGGGREALVVVSTVEEKTTNDRITAIGSGQAARTVSLRPTVAGQIASVSITSGANVKAGDVLITLDTSEEKLSLERAELNLQPAQDRYDRLNTLFSRGSIGSVEVDAARDALNLAKLAARDAELALSRRIITAPIDGTIGILTVSNGDYVTSQNDIATIDDRSQIVVDFFVPERQAGLMDIGLPVTVIPTALPGERFTGTVLATDNRIDEASRTLRVRAAIPNPDSKLRAGMSFEIVMEFPGQSYPSIDPLALQWDSQGSYIWQVTDNKANRVPAIIVQRNNDSILVKSDITAGDTIIIEGVQSVRNGAAVNIVNQEGKASETRPARREGQAS